MLRRAVLAALLSAGFTIAASAATIEYAANLTAKKEVPKGTGAGNGKLTATLDPATKQLSYTLSFQNLSGPATGAHFHGPAKHTESGPVIAPIGSKDPVSPVSGAVTLTDEQVKQLKAGLIYVNVHTAANPGDEIRGTVAPVGKKKGAVKSDAAKPAPSKM